MLDRNAAAPDLEIETHTDYKGPLSHFWQEGPLILFFYPKDETPICTKQACSLQASMGEFGNFGARVLGCGTGSMEAHHRFAGKHGIAFPLIHDPEGKLARAYDAWRSLMRIPKRVTYVISREGKIVDRIHNELSVNAHLDLIRKTLS